MTIQDSITGKRALICGVTGQDGALLAKLLLGKGYEVWGTSRDAQAANQRSLHALTVEGRVRLCTMLPHDFRSVLRAVMACRPCEIYFLAGQTSVGLSFEQPAETIESIVLGTLNLLEVCRTVDFPIRLYNAGSSECFGDTGGHRADETTPFRPNSPYAVAKTASHMLVNNYREAYGLFACTGILFNHESPLRPTRFVTAKIVNAAVRIANGSGEKLHLGRLDIVRDWGWAAEYVEAMWMMLQQPRPEDFVVGTGRCHTLEDFVKAAFDGVGLDWRKHVVPDLALQRPTDPKVIAAEPAKAWCRLGWRATMYMPEVVAEMLRHARQIEAEDEI